MRAGGIVRDLPATSAQLLRPAPRQPNRIAVRRMIQLPQRHPASTSAARKPLEVCAAASFTSGAGEASFSKGDKDAGANEGGVAAKGLKVAVYMLLW